MYKTKVKSLEMGMQRAASTLASEFASLSTNSLHKYRYHIERKLVLVYNKHAIG